MTTTKPTFCEAKNVGRANATSISEQVILEVESKIKKQYDLGYTDDIPSGERRFDVSLANKYIDRVKKNKLEFPYVYQPKLDGIRCYIRLVDGKVKAFSRNHKEFASIPHILGDPVINELFRNNPDLILDGELYNHKLWNDFNKICSIIAKKKLTKDDISKSKEYIKFNCFDCLFNTSPDLPYTERNEKLFSIVKEYQRTVDVDEDYEDPLVFVSSSGISADEYANFYVNTPEEVDEKIKAYIADGFEGIMLKKNVPYTYARSNNLLKYKFFKDEEFEIIGFEEGTGNMSGLATTVICVNDKGIEFRAGTCGTEEYRRKLLEEAIFIVGKMCTVKYQELTPVDDDGNGGVPRFGKMTSIRDYE